VESVSGGGHWGGGLFISAQDHARVGLLVARGGEWDGRQLVSKRYLAELATPSPANPQYGFMWWLNTGRKLFPSAPESSVFALGAGQHLIWIDDVHDLLMVVRWIDKAHCDRLIALVLASLEAG